MRINKITQTGVILALGLFSMNTMAGERHGHDHGHASSET